MATTKVKVEIVYKDSKKNKTMFFDLKGKPKGARLMSATEAIVEKTLKDDKEWTRWNLLDVLTSEST